MGTVRVQSVLDCGISTDSGSGEKKNAEIRNTYRGQSSDLLRRWEGSVCHTESTLHQLSPYIGKMKSSMAASLIAQYTKPNDVVFDPFAGSGTVALEAWIAGRNIIANDLSPYASLLTRAKLFPYRNAGEAHRDLKTIARLVSRRNRKPDLRSVPKWVREFFHADTLKEIIVWKEELTKQRRWFLLACLMGILHHQRPGFLSFPSSHAVPYLRVKKFPRHHFPELYKYRPVFNRLEAKVSRAMRRVPILNFNISRRHPSKNASELSFTKPVDAIITSPPYMRQLDYGRDNRLRLWFLGHEGWRDLDRVLSPHDQDFLTLMSQCFKRWRSTLRYGGYCVLVIGDVFSRGERRNLATAIANIATKEQGFSLVSFCTEQIPNERRVRRGIKGSSSETILVLRNVGDKATNRS